MTTDPKLYKELATILNQSQDGIAIHAKLIQRCQKLYKEVRFYSLNLNYKYVLTFHHYLILD